MAPLVCVWWLTIDGRLLFLRIYCRYFVKALANGFYYSKSTKPKMLIKALPSGISCHLPVFTTFWLSTITANYFRAKVSPHWRSGGSNCPFNINIWLSYQPRKVIKHWHQLAVKLVGISCLLLFQPPTIPSPYINWLRPLSLLYSNSSSIWYRRSVFLAISTYYSGDNSYLG